MDEEEEEEDDEEEDEDEEEEDDEDDQEMMPIMEKRATMFAKWPNETEWEIIGLGNLAIHYDSDIYAERIILKLDDSEEYASNTIISMGSVMQVIIFIVFLINFFFSYFFHVITWIFILSLLLYKLYFIFVLFEFIFSHI